MTLAEDTGVSTGNQQKKICGANMDNPAMKDFNDSHSNCLSEENRCVDSGETDVGGGEDGEGSEREGSGAIIEGTSYSMASEENKAIDTKPLKREFGSESGGFWTWMTHRIKDV